MIYELLTIMASSDIDHPLVPDEGRNVFFKPIRRSMLRDIYHDHPRVFRGQDPNRWAGRDVRAFLSLVLQQLISADEEVSDAAQYGGPKNKCTFMPRTSWTIVYHQVADQIPGNLWNIIRHLFYYTVGAGGYV